jgi:hypothetical protein
MAVYDDAYNVALPITKSDTVNFPIWANRGLVDAIHVGGAGIVVAVLEDNSTVQLTCVAGQVIKVRCKRVNSTTTTATLMVGQYRM